MLKAPASLAKQQERLTLFSFSNRLCPFTMDNWSILDFCNVSLVKTYVLLICYLTLFALALIFLLLRSIFDAQQTIALLQHNPLALHVLNYLAHASWCIFNQAIASKDRCRIAVMSYKGSVRLKVYQLSTQILGAPALVSTAIAGVDV